VLAVGHAVELEDDHFAGTAAGDGLARRPAAVGRASPVVGMRSGWSTCGFEGDAAADGVGHLGFAAPAAGEADAGGGDREGGDVEFVAGPSEADRGGDTVLAATVGNRGELHRRGAGRLFP
jgi:hypothetical protein